MWDTEILRLPLPAPPQSTAPPPTLQDQNVGNTGGIMSTIVGILEDIARGDGPFNVLGGICHERLNFCPSVFW